VWANFEAIQADIFDHLLAVLPEFELGVFQEPSGLDVKALADSIRGRDGVDGPRGTAREVGSIH